MAWFSWEKMCAPKDMGGLGFRDLKAFNLALLAKQGQRLQMNPNSLVHRVLKARYFPQTDFLHAKLGLRPSYAQRSILSAQMVVKTGYRWQVGDRESIAIWIDRWLPRPSTFQVLTPPPSHSANTKVSSLINPDNGEWNVHMINQLFLLADVMSILSIPLSCHKPRDKLVWAYTPRGNFMVNSAYKVAISMTRCNSVAETSHGALHTSFWRKIWNLHIPPKIKLFTQKACQDILPTKANLCHRHILDSPTCETCKTGSETVGHPFWDCPSTSKVWSTLYIQWRLQEFFSGCSLKSINYTI